MSSRTSKTVNTTLLGAAGLTAMFVLTGCDEDDVTSHAYQTVEQCVAADVYDDNFCRARFEEAQRTHEELAPRYEDIQDCEADFGEGQCDLPQQTANASTGSTNSFVPFMWGYMMGNSNSGPSSYTTPVYRSKSEGYRALSGAQVPSRAFTSAGAQVRPSHALAKPTAAQTFKSGVSVTSRGGFGATGRGMSMGS